ncbi:MAG: ATP-binding protein, partial [Campylobacterales bacterium]|nr:ATP-binding protein [Campylobacterales bacterium]
AKVGEVALANGGILFLDELPHFPKQILEALREPLENNKLLVSRVNSKIEYDTSFLLLAAQNPCPCGNLLSNQKECRCTDIEIKRYKSKLSDPFLDRIDMFVVMNDVKSSDKTSTNSAFMRDVVLKTFMFQKNRKQQNLNGKLTDSEIKKYCILSNDAQKIVESAIDKFGLSNRAINKILKVARTIADMKESQKIEKTDILEALSYRKR